MTRCGPRPEARRQKNYVLRRCHQVVSKSECGTDLSAPLDGCFLPAIFWRKHCRSGRPGIFGSVFLAP
jgi:hypothetical protein